MTTTPGQTAAPATATDVTSELLDTWATDPRGPVALHLRQKLLPVESVDGDEGVIYPPTYADIGYNIDALSDDTKVALIDSVGSQANRMEPIFKATFKTSTDGEAEDWLVPQIEIVLTPEKVGKGKTRDEHRERRSVLDLAHRGADAVVQSSPGLVEQVSKAFEALRRTGDAGPLCALIPTSLVFGVWDSRGGTGEKRPRLVRSIIRAWNVEPLHAAAQFNSVWKALDEDQRAELEKEAKAKKTKLSEKGLADAPAVFRKNIPKSLRDGTPNAEARVLGGVLVRDRIEREVTVNLVALRGLRGKSPEETKHIQKYLLGLSLVAATTDIDLFLREGCNLRYTGGDVWYSVPRRGEPSRVDLGSDAARTMIQLYAATEAAHFRPRWPKVLEYSFDLSEAKKLLAKKDDENASEPSP
jgi:CRISPR-associated protein Csb1